VLVGVRNVEQLDDNLKALINKTFTADELKAIEKVLKG
jgi:aryl-alcohol dehydrogenase-like predicted oxidoreductase